MTSGYIQSNVSIVGMRWSSDLRKETIHHEVIDKITINQWLRDPISTLTAHSAKCGRKFTIEGESMYSGLVVIFQASCVKCGQIFSFRKSPCVQTSSGKMGGHLGYSSWRNVHQWWFDMVELYTGTLWMSHVCKANVHRDWRASREINAHTSYAIIAEVAEEKRHIIATNSFHQGIPSITVVVDRGWSKRSHKHSYNAKNGVAVIFWSHTKNYLLFMRISKQILYCVCYCNK